MLEPSPVVITRILRPKRRPDLLRRARLLDFLHENIDRKLILVSAAPGYGKTSLLIDFANDTDIPIAWYTLRETDRDVRVFVEYFIASIRQCFPTFGQKTEAFLANAHTGVVDPGTLSNLLVNDIYTDIPDYFAIVLDDYHLADCEGVSFLLDSMLHHLPENCHIILASRTTPRLTPKGMALLIARREVAGIGTNDLRFSAAEIQALLAQNYHQHIPNEQAEALAREAEGWITGIILTTHSLWKGLFANILHAKGPTSQIYEYLANEVFDQQTPEVQAFLRGSAVLDEMTASLCNRLLDRRDSRQMLALIEERNLFITHVEKDDEVWYRYHNLFQRFLGAKSVETGEHDQLHARAAAILETDGDLAQAIYHYRCAGLHHEAARVTDLAAAAEYEHNHWRTLADWIDALPAHVLADYPRLLKYRANIHAQLGELDQSLALFAQAQQAFERQGDRVGLADVAISRATPLRFSGRLQEAIDACEQALQILSGIPSSRETTKSRAEARRTIGICTVQLGKLQEGTEQLRRSLALFEEVGDRYGTANLHSDLGTALRMVGNLTASDVHFQRAMEIWEELGASAALANTLNNVGLGYHLRGQYAKALEVYERALAIAQEMALWRVHGIVLTGMGDVYRDLDQFDQALAAYTEARPIAERAQEAWLVSYILDALGNTYILTGDLVRAHELIRQAYDQARERGSRQSAAIYQASLGIVSYERGDTTLAIEQLEEAARTLEEIGAQRDLPRVHLHLAQAYYLHGQWGQALETLGRALDEAFALGYDQFLEPVGRRMLPFLAFAHRQRAENERLADFLQRAQQPRPSSAPETLPPLPVVSTTPRLKIYGFGDTRVVRGDTPIDQRAWGTAKAKELLFYLLSFPHRRKEQIGATFWPDLPPSRLRSAFHVTLYRLRRALDVPDCILFEDDRYYVNPHIEVWYDVQEFERLIAAAERVRLTSPEECESYLKQAVALYRGDFLDDLAVSSDSWYTPRVEELRKRYLQSLLILAQMAGQRGDDQEALAYYQRIARKDSYQEVAHRGIMAILARTGDRNAALRHYRELEKLLQDELGVSPMPETIQLYEQILSGRLS